MPRKKQTKQDELPLSIPEPAVPATPEGEAVLEALRSNHTLLGELAARYQVAFQPERSRREAADQLPRRRAPAAGAGDVGPWPRSS